MNRLRLPATPSERAEFADEMLASWFGVLLPVKTPRGTAREAWSHLARLPRVLSLQDTFFPIEAADLDNDFLVIGRENQGCVHWGVPARSLEDDPPVLMREGPDGSWLHETETLSLFALQQLLVTAKWSDHVLHANGAIEADIEYRLAEIFIEIEIGEVSWPGCGTRVFTDSEKQVLVEFQGDTWVWLSAKSEKSLRETAAVLSSFGVDWQ